MENRYREVKGLLALLLEQYPVIITHLYLSELLKPIEIKKLISLSVLKEMNPLTSLPCPECGNGNDVLYDKHGNPYYVCPCENGGRVELYKDEIKRYELSLQEIFQRIVLAFETKAIVGTVKDDILWRLCIVERQGRQFELLFYRDNRLDKSILPINTYPFKIIVFFGKTTIVDNTNCYINIFDIIGPEMSFSAKTVYDYINVNVKEVYLETNGDLYVSNTKTYNLKSDTPEYFFLKYLFDHYGIACDNSDIHKYVETEYKKLKHKSQWSYEDDPDQFCRKMKSNIKSKIKNGKLKTIFNKCLIATRTNSDILAYKLSNSST